MEKIMCRTTLHSYGWPEAWWVKDAESIPKPWEDEKRCWIRLQAILCVETVGGWSFRHKQDAIQFVLTWS